MIKPFVPFFGWGIVVLFVSRAEAQDYGQYYSSPSTRPAPTYSPYTVSRARAAGLPGLARDYATDQADVDIARADLEDAQRLARGTYAKLKDEAERSPELRSAQQNADAAYDDYQNQRQEAISRLSHEATYQKAQEDYRKLSMQMAEIKANPASTMLQRTQTAEAKMRMGSFLTRMESDAIQKDTEARQARQRFLDGVAHVRAVREQLAQAVEQDAGYQAALDNAADARDRLMSKMRSLAGSSAAYDQAVSDQELRYGHYYYRARRHGYWGYAGYYPLGW